MNHNWSPCQLIDHTSIPDGPCYSIIFSDFEVVSDFLEEREIENDGYTWQEIVETLIRKYNPELLPEIDFDSESSMFCVRSSDLEALALVCNWIRKVLHAPNVLDQAIDR